jgi:two-component system, chemotaxis family, response regulator Rcp1
MSNSEKARILLAEDNPADVYLIERALRLHGVRFQLELAESGKDALKLLSRYSDSGGATEPQLIVLDLNLPQHDGVEILRHVRQMDVLRDIPVVVLTSSDSPRDHIQSLECGASRYLKKPSSLEEFMAIGGVLKDLISSPPRLAAVSK